MIENWSMNDIDRAIRYWKWLSDGGDRTIPPTLRRRRALEALIREGESVLSRRAALFPSLIPSPTE